MKINIFTYQHGQKQQRWVHNSDDAIVDLLAVLLPSLNDIALISLSGSRILTALSLAEPFSQHRYSSFEVRINAQFWGTIDID